MTLLGLYIGYDGEHFTKVFLGKPGTLQLYNYLFPVIANKAPAFLDEFEGVAFCGGLDISGLSRQYYPDICTAILNACDELDSLQPFKAELKTALEADPRFQLLQTA